MTATISTGMARICKFMRSSLAVPLTVLILSPRDTSIVTIACNHADLLSWLPKQHLLMGASTSLIVAASLLKTIYLSSD